MTRVIEELKWKVASRGQNLQENGFAKVPKNGRKHSKNSKRRIIEKLSF